MGGIEAIEAWRMPLSSLWIEGDVDRVGFTSQEARRLYTCNISSIGNNVTGTGSTEMPRPTLDGC